MSEIIQFKYKRLRFAYQINIAEDLSAGLYGIAPGADGWFLIKIFARSWDEAEDLRVVAENRANEEYLKMT